MQTPRDSDADAFEAAVDLHVEFAEKLQFSGITDGSLGLSGGVFSERPVG